MRITELIQKTRKRLGETRIVFGKRFGVTDTAVYQWEKGNREAAYKVIEFCFEAINKISICPACKGKGIINN